MSWATQSPSGNSMAMPSSFLASAAMPSAESTFPNTTHTTPVVATQQQPAAAGRGGRVKLTTTISRGCVPGGTLGLISPVQPPTVSTTVRMPCGCSLD